MKLKAALIISFILLLSKAKYSSADVLYTEKTIVKPNVVISTVIGIPKMTLWGYGPPGSHIELSGVGVEQTTMSKANGYYSFDLVYLKDTGSFPELCVTAIDYERNATPPTCIPPIPKSDYFYNVGPVILPPTISLGTPQTNPGSQVSAQGVTIPNSTIDVKLARPDEKKGIMGFKLVGRALAYYIPSFSVKSDASGNYSFNMPIEEGTSWRVFAITEYSEGGKSPKSNTLKLETLTPVSYVWKKISSFLASLLQWPRVIALEILLILLLAVIVAVTVRKRKRTAVKKEVIQVDQNYSNLVKRYQQFLKDRQTVS